MFLQLDIIFSAQKNAHTALSVSNHEVFVAFLISEIVFLFLPLHKFTFRRTCATDLAELGWAQYDQNFVLVLSLIAVYTEDTSCSVSLCSMEFCGARYNASASSKTKSLIQRRQRVRNARRS